jgi:hypothetical protein
MNYMGPTLIFDKSFLQSINADESVWLDMFFSTNITPLFFIETLADLEKQVHKGRTPEQVVGNLATKTPDMDSRPNVHHRTMLTGELSGQATIDMHFGRPIVSGGTQTELDGQKGVVFEQTPEEEAFNRWQKGQFLDLERQQAKLWRRQLLLISPENQKAMFSPWFQSAKPSNLAEVKQIADTFIDSSDIERSLLFGLALLGIQPEGQAIVISRWKTSGKRPVSEFAPYFRHVYGIELFFYLGLAANLISQRLTNKVDIAYLYYLPFCMVFTSNDKLHMATVPLFLQPHQSFVSGFDLKDELGTLDRHFSALPEEVKRRGVHHFASQPPHDPAFLVARLWDRHMRPEWRDLKSTPDTKSPTSAEMVAKINRAVVASRSGANRSTKESDEMDYVITTHYVHKRKGKWNRFPPEVADKTDSSNA